MTDRLVKEYVKGENALETVFGENGKRGREGELFVIEYLWNVRKANKVTDHKDDSVKQNQGIDISFYKEGWAREYTVSVKNNLDKYGSFYVHDEIKTNQADDQYHVNSDTGWIAHFRVADMKQFYSNQTNLATKDGNAYLKVTIKESPSFVRRSRYLWNKPDVS